MKSSRIFVLTLYGAIGCHALAWATDDSAVPAAPERAPPCATQPLSISDWDGIIKARDADRHAARAADDGGLQAWNPGQRWQTTFDGRGFLTTPDDVSVCDWTWGLELVSYGLSGQERLISGQAKSSAAGQRIAYEWDSTLTEWYINDGRGLEHGYTVHDRPGPGAGPLRLTLAVRGDLCAEVQHGGKDVRFVNAEGAVILNYAGLTVFDADGARVPAGFEVVSDHLLLTIDDRAARYPITIDPTAQQAYLKAAFAGIDSFGESVAISGDTVVVGARGEASNATGVNGNQSNNSALAAGAAYVFVRVGGVWSQQAYLKASNTQAGDEFGWRVGISGDTVVVTAWAEDSNATGVNGNGTNNSADESGAAYVFVRSGGVWSQQAYLKASNTGSNDQFGQAVSVSGDTVIVGAPLEDCDATGVNGNQANNNAPEAGAAYVFVRSGGVWSQQAYLKASNTGTTDEFGRSVSADGERVVIGSAFEDGIDNGLPGSGAAYVFVRSGAVWSQEAYLKASNSEAQDFFGISVSMNGDTVVVGANSEDSNATGVDGDEFNNGAPTSGAAYVFVRNGAIWSQQAYLKASNTGPSDRFGFSSAINGNTVVIGAYSEDSNATGVNGDGANNNLVNSGAAYVFVRNGVVWSHHAYLKASNPAIEDHFGNAVAVSGTTAVVGARHEFAGQGAAYVFLLDVPSLIPGDLNGDGSVNGADLGIVLGNWGPCAGCPADINGDGTVDGADLGLVLSNWTG